VGERLVVQPSPSSSRAERALQNGQSGASREIAELRFENARFVVMSGENAGQDHAARTTSVRCSISDLGEELRGA
jgi:hypothetical protein